MKNSLKRDILNRFQELPNVWVNGAKIEEFALRNGHKPSNGGRRARELAAEGLLERRVTGKSVSYMFKSPSQ